MKSSQSLGVFKRNGDFLFKISRSGKGPGEYSSLADYWVDEQNHTIDILDSKLGKILSFDWNGKFLKESIHEIKSFGVCRWDENSYFIYNGNQINDLTNYQLNYLVDDKIAWNAFPIDLNKYEYLYFLENNFPYSAESNKQLFLYSTNDTIYEITPDRITPKIIIDYGKYKIPLPEFDRKYESIAGFILYMQKKDYAFGYLGFNETSDNIVFGYRFGEKCGLVYHNKSSGNTKNVGAISEDISFPGITQQVTYGNFPMASYKNSLFYLKQPYDLISKVDSLKSVMTESEWVTYSKKNSSLINIYHSININSNPILFETVLKDF